MNHPGLHCNIGVIHYGGIYSVGDRSLQFIASASVWLCLLLQKQIQQSHVVVATTSGAMMYGIYGDEGAGGHRAANAFGLLSIG